MNYPEEFKKDMENTHQIYFSDEDLDSMYDYYWVDQESHVIDYLIEVNK